MEHCSSFTPEQQVLQSEEAVRAAAQQIDDGALPVAAPVGQTHDLPVAAPVAQTHDLPVAAPVGQGSQTTGMPVAKPVDETVATQVPGTMRISKEAAATPSESLLDRLAAEVDDIGTDVGSQASLAALPEDASPVRTGASDVIGPLATPVETSAEDDGPLFKGGGLGLLDQFDDDGEMAGPETNTAVPAEKPPESAPSEPHVLETSEITPIPDSQDDSEAAPTHNTTEALSWMDSNDNPAITASTHAEDLDRARDVQQGMLREAPKLPGYTFATRFESCDAVSGDFYEFIAWAMAALDLPRATSAAMASKLA